MQQRKADERAQQRHGNDKRGNDGGPEILQEHQHHDEHERDRFDQRVNHIGDRGRDEWRGVIGHAPRHPGGQIPGKRRHLCLDRIGDRQRVGTGQQEDRHPTGGLAVIDRCDTVRLRAEADPRHVGEPHRRAVASRQQDDVAELLQR
ncbi:hypothetical protein D3C81_1355960 [compost metagenome]